MSTDNLCFEAKIRKIGIPCKPQYFYIKVGFKGVYFSLTCFPDVLFSHHFQDPEVPLFLLRNVCFFCDTNGIGALKTCFEKATPETLPFNFAHLLITLIANVSHLRFSVLTHI